MLGFGDSATLGTVPSSGLTIPRVPLEEPQPCVLVCFYSTSDGSLLHSPAALGDPSGLYFLRLLCTRHWDKMNKTGMAPAFTGSDRKHGSPSISRLGLQYPKGASGAGTQLGWQARASGNFSEEKAFGL